MRGEQGGMGREGSEDPGDREVMDFEGCPMRRRACGGRPSALWVLATSSSWMVVMQPGLEARGPLQEQEFHLVLQLRVSCSNGS